MSSHEATPIDANLIGYTHNVYYKKIPIFREDNWEILELVGRGTYSKVYKCIYKPNQNSDCKLTDKKYIYNIFQPFFPNSDSCSSSDNSEIDHNYREKLNGKYIKINVLNTFAIKIPYGKISIHILYENLIFHAELAQKFILPNIISYGFVDKKIYIVMDKYKSNGKDYCNKIIEKDNYHELRTQYFHNVLFLINKLAENGICTMDINNKNVVVNYDNNYRLLDMKLIDIDVLFTNKTNDISPERIKVNYILMCIIWYSYSLYQSGGSIYALKNYDLFRLLLCDINCYREEINNNFNLDGYYKHLQKKGSKWTYSQILCMRLKLIIRYKNKHLVNRKIFAKCVDKIINSLKTKKKLMSLINEIEMKNIY